MRKRIVLYVRRFSGKLILKFARLRNRAWEEHLRSRLASVGPTAVLEYPLRISHPERVHLGRTVRLCWWSRFSAQQTGRIEPRIFIGDGTYIGNHAEIVATTKITIGKNVLLADRVHLNDSRPRTDGTCGDGSANGEIEIGDGSWLGENARVLGGVRIGPHCVIGANALVTQNVPPFSVVVGSPARIIKRYDFETERWELTEPDGRLLRKKETIVRKLRAAASPVQALPEEKP